MTSGQNPPSITYAGPGTYTACLTVTSAAGCTDTMVCDSFVIGPNAISENDFSGITISPNPSSGTIFLDFGSKNFGEAEISFSDVLGQTLYTASISATGKQEINLSELSKGIYFMKLKTDSGEVTKKIMIAR